VNIDEKDLRVSLMSAKFLEPIHMKHYFFMEKGVACVIRNINGDF
jgi:hypothetical protein